MASESRREPSLWLLLILVYDMALRGCMAELSVVDLTLNPNGTLVRIYKIKCHISEN